MIVVDTLARAMVGNENSPEDMGAFVSACGALREAGDTFVLIVHHCGKNTALGARGHSCLRAATDFEEEITLNEEGEGSVKVTKNRDDYSGRVLGFRLDTFELGLNRKGRMVTTCVVTAASAPKAEPKKRKLGPNEKIALQCLAAAIVDHGQVAPTGNVHDHARAATRDAWLATATRHLTQGKPWHREQAFDRAAESLTADYFVRHQNGLYWLPNGATHDTHGHA